MLFGALAHNPLAIHTLFCAADNAEGQVESVPAPGAEEPQSCCPIYTLQYLTSGQEQTRTCLASHPLHQRRCESICVAACIHYGGKKHRPPGASVLLFCSSLSSFICY